MSRSSSRKKHKTVRDRNRAWLQVEALEDRLVPTSVANGVISGFVYYDANNNGVFDASETPIANSQILLINNSNNQIAGATYTAADGSYSFTTDGTQPGPEQHTQPQSVTLGPTTTNFQEPGQLPQFDPSLGTLDKAVITENGSIVSNINAENTSPVADTITGIVSGNFSLSAPGVSNDLLSITGQPNTFQAAANGSDDKSFTGPSSTGWANVTASNVTPNTITITDPNVLASDYTGTGTVNVTETGNATSNATDTTGNITTDISSTGQATLTVTYYYHAGGPLEANTIYTVEQVDVPTGYVPGLNSKNGTILPYNPTPPEKITNIIVNQQNPVAPNNNFGELQTASVAGYAYIENNPGDLFTPGTTPPLANVTMTLTGGNLTTPLTTTTAQDGSYSFGNILPGSYTITQTQPAGYLPDAITAGSDGGTVGTEKIAQITINPGDTATGYNFGELNLPSIAGYAYVENNQGDLFNPPTTPPLAGVTMTLSGGNLTKSLTTTTAQDGSFSFGSLQPGTYTITQTQPAGYVSDTITAGSDGGTVGTETIGQITINPGDAATGYDFGELNQPSLAGFVYYEPNAPTQTLYTDPVSTPGIGGVTVTLTGSDGSTKTTTTAQDGSYSFTPLTAGVTYDVKITHPAGYLVGTDTAGSEGGTVSSTSEDISQVQLTAGTAATDYDFGEIQPSSLAGNVYVDAKNDGQLDPGDPPIAKDTITLSGFNDQGPINPLTTPTAADGSYSFGNLRPGTYAIVQSPVAGYTDGATTVGSQGGTGAAENISSISLTPDVAGVGNNFGEIKPNQPGNPLPKDVGPLGMLPIISKVQLTSIPEPVAIDAKLHGQMAFIVGTTMTLTGQQLSAVQTLDAVNALQNGVSPQTFVNQVYTSQAARALQVNKLYESILGRAPTSQEQATAISQLNTGTSSLTMMQTLYTSAEFQQKYSTTQSLATALSQDILNTTPGSVQTQALVQSLGVQTLDSVVNTLLTSTASVENLIDNVYLEVLRRNASAAEIATWTAPIQAGTMTLDQLAQRLLTSQEFYTLAYNSVH